MTKFSFAEEVPASSISIMTEKTMRSMVVIVCQVTKKATADAVAFEKSSQKCCSGSMKGTTSVYGSK